MFSKLFSSFLNNSTASSKKMWTGIIFFSTKRTHRILFYLQQSQMQIERVMSGKKAN